MSLYITLGEKTYFFFHLSSTILLLISVALTPCIGEDLKSPQDLTHYAYVSNAVESGVQEANNLFESIEPQLYKKDYVIRGDHPSVYLAAINRQHPKAKELARVAYATLKATSVLKEQFEQSRDERDPPISEISLSNTPLSRSNCPAKRQLSDDCPEWTAKYRKVDGTCNNVLNPHFGASFQPFGRFLPPEYDDGISTIRRSVTGNELPSARKVSTKIHKDVSRPSSTFTLMLMQWGQFLDHDLTATSQTRSFNHSIPKCCHVEQIHPDCLPIKVPEDDPYFNGTDCMEFIRSSPAPRLDCSLGAREQLNQITPWLDGSAVYGSTDVDLQVLRTFSGGKLKQYNMSRRKALLPQLVHPPDGECFVSSPRLFCFAAGDPRVNEQPGLTTMHTLWLRQHNLVAESLSAINPHWNEEKLFQETRKIIVAQIQYISFREFLPLILGMDVLKLFELRLLRSGHYNGYNNSIDPTVPSAFAAAAFRFGHSLVQPHLHRCDEAHREMPYKIELSQEMMSPTNIHNLGEIDRITLGLASQMSQKRDQFITSQLTNHLFQTSHHKGLDLAAINIQRGRDHGLPPYLKWREACGINKPLPGNKAVSTWEDFSLVTQLPMERVKQFSEVYESPWDVDLFPGGMVEPPVRGGMVGPTFACIIAQTLRNVRKGDRFWFENPGQFTDEQLQAIRNTTLARVLCDNGDSIKTIQPIVLLTPHDQKNPHANCTDSKAIPEVFFGPWFETPLTPSEINAQNANAIQFDEPQIQPNTGSPQPLFYSVEQFIDSGEETSDTFTDLPSDFYDKLRIFT